MQRIKCVACSPHHCSSSSPFWLIACGGNATSLTPVPHVYNGSASGPLALQAVTVTGTGDVGGTDTLSPCSPNGWPTLPIQIAGPLAGSTSNLTFTATKSETGDGGTFDRHDGHQANGIVQWIAAGRRRIGHFELQRGLRVADRVVCRGRSNRGRFGSSRSFHCGANSTRMTLLRGSRCVS